MSPEWTKYGLSPYLNLSTSHSDGLINLNTMRTIEVKLYEFNELSEEAKERAISQARKSRWDYDWADESLESLIAFFGALGTKVLNYSIDWEFPSQSYIKLSNYEIDKDFKFSKDYKLTGYYMDYPLMETWNKTRDINEAISSFLKDCAEDYKWQISDEGVANFIINNEYQFTENGNRYDYI